MLSQVQKLNTNFQQTLFQARPLGGEASTSSQITYMLCFYTMPS